MEQEVKRGRKPRLKDNIGLIVSAGMDFRRAIQANMVALGGYMQPENIERLRRLRDELKEAERAAGVALKSFESALSQLEKQADMQARIDELERQNAEMIKRLSTSGHSDAIPPAAKNKGGGKGKAPSADMVAA